MPWKDKIYCCAYHFSVVQILKITTNNPADMTMQSLTFIPVYPTRNLKLNMVEICRKNGLNSLMVSHVFWFIAHKCHEQFFDFFLVVVSAISFTPCHNSHAYLGASQFHTKLSFKFWHEMVSLHYKYGCINHHTQFLKQYKHGRSKPLS